MSMLHLNVLYVMDKMKLWICFNFQFNVATILWLTLLWLIPLGKQYENIMFWCEIPGLDAANMAEHVLWSN